MATDRASAAPAPATPAAATQGRNYVRIGYLFAATGAILFSTKAVIIKFVYEYPVDAATLLALRMAFALPFYVVIGAFALFDRRKRGDPLPSRRLVLRAALIGMLGYWFASYTDFLGLEYISAQFERLILFTYPLFVVVFGALFFRQSISMRALAAIGLSYAGLALIFSEKLTALGSEVAVGSSLVLVSAVSFALYLLLAKDVIAAMGPRLFTCVAMGTAGLAVFAQFFLTHPGTDLLVGPEVLALAAIIGIGATVVPSFFLNAALHRISAQANGTIGTLSPIMTILLAVVILGERLTVVDIAGTALVLAGVGWFTLADQSGRRRA